jgi:hypothetical protein
LLKDLHHDITTKPRFDQDSCELLGGFQRHWELLTKLGTDGLIGLLQYFRMNFWPKEELKWLLNVVQRENKTYSDFNSYWNYDQGRFDKFAQALFKFDSWGLRVLQSVWIGIIRDYLDKYELRNLYKEYLRKMISNHIVYFYRQVVEHFDGSYSEKILHINRPKELDAQLALKAYHTYFRLFQKERTKNQRNLLQENKLDNIFYPSYFMILPSVFKVIISWGGQKQSYSLNEEGLKKSLENGGATQKSLTFMDRQSSHIQILKFPKGSDGGQEEEMKMFLIPSVFKYLTQEKKDQLWLSFDKENASTFWISVWKNWHEIFREFYAREQVNQMTFFGFFSEHETKVGRLIEHLILVTNLFVLITQGYKDDYSHLGSTPYATTLVILFFFGTCMLSMSCIFWFISLEISFKSRK